MQRLYSDSLVLLSAVVTGERLGNGETGTDRQVAKKTLGTFRFPCWIERPDPHRETERGIDCRSFSKEGLKLRLNEATFLKPLSHLVGTHGFLSSALRHHRKIVQVFHQTSIPPERQHHSGSFPRAIRHIPFSDGGRLR
jgi:hypothetical protein